MKKHLHFIKWRSATTLADSLVGMMIISLALTLYFDANRLMVQQRRHSQTELIQSRLKYEQNLQQRYQK